MSDLAKAARRALLLSLLACAACNTPAPAEEESVKPGFNDNFLDPDLNVDEFVARFEVESREVFVHRDRVAAALGLATGMTVADIGAGTGLFTPLLADAVGPDGKVYAVDISPRFVAHLRAKTADLGLDQVEVVLCDERSANLPEGSVDLIFVCDTYHHFEYPRSTLASLHRALKPGGRLVIVDFERIPGVSSEWVLGHVRANKEEFTAEMVEAGFVFDREVDVQGLRENYLIVLDRL